MTTNINADDGVISGVAGLKTSADNSGVLALQTNGTTALTVNASQALGVGSTPSYGTSGQVLSSSGSSASPTWVTPSAGAMTLISTQTASNSASISWTGLSGYNHYMLIVDGISPNTSGATFYVQVGTGAGPTYITSGYSTNSLAAVGTGAPYNTVSVTTALIQSNEWNGGIRTTSYASGSLILNNMTNSKLTVGSGILSHIDTTNNALNLVIVNGQSTGNTTAKTAVRILFDFGNIASGTASLYGITS